jgi:ribosomal protein S18 acetylase RimI-like enzyme
MTDIVYAREQDLSVDDYVEVLSHCALGRKRPLSDRDRVEVMLRNSNIIVTARLDGRCVGIARCFSDFGWTTYLSDLAVHDDFQKRGIGRRLIETVREVGGDGVGIGLFSVPDAIGFYEKLSDIGVSPEPGFWLPRIHGV